LFLISGSSSSARSFWTLRFSGWLRPRLWSTPLRAAAPPQTTILSTGS